MRRSIVHRITPLKRVGWCLVFLGFVNGCRYIVPSREAPTGVILIMMDAARVDHFGFMGYLRSTTPVIDALSRESVVFTEARSMATYTIASIASLWTGLYPKYHGIQGIGDLIPPPLETLPMYLHRAGIRTGMFYANPMILDKRGFGRGFDTVAFLPWHLNKSPDPNRLFRRALTWIRQQRQPYFAYIHVMQPHDPYAPPKRYVFAMGRNIPPRHFGLSQWVRGVATGVYPPHPRGVKAMITWYDASLRWVDDAIGRFLRELNAAGYFNRAWVILTADHGEAFGEGGAFYHGNHVMESGAHVPLIVHPPERTGLSPRRIKRRVLMQDLHSTIPLMFRLKPLAQRDTLPLLELSRRYRPKKRPFLMVCGEGNVTCARYDGVWKTIWRWNTRTRVPVVARYRLPEEGTFWTNRAPFHWRKVQALTRQYLVWSETGQWEAPASALTESRRVLKSLGYLGENPAGFRFHLLPAPLTKADLRGVIRTIGWTLSRDGKLMWRLGLINRSAVPWSALSFRGKGRIVLVVERKSGNIKISFREDLYPGRMAEVHVPWQRGSGRAVIRLIQEGTGVSRPLAVVDVDPPEIVIVPGKGWRRADTLGYRRGWRLARTGEFMIYGERSGCRFLRFWVRGYGRSRRLQIRVNNEIRWSGEVATRRMRMISLKLKDQRELIRLEWRILGRPVIPADVDNETTDQVPTGLVVEKWTSEGCSLGAARRRTSPPHR